MNHDRSHELFARARTLLPGGVNSPDNGRALVEAGADLLAVIGGVFDAPDPAAAVRAYRRCFL